MNTYIDINTYIHTCIRTYTHTHIHTYIHTYIQSLLTMTRVLNMNGWGRMLENLMQATGDNGERPTHRIRENSIPLLVFQVIVNLILSQVCMCLCVYVFYFYYYVYVCMWVSLTGYKREQYCVGVVPGYRELDTQSGIYVCVYICMYPYVYMCVLYTYSIQTRIQAHNTYTNTHIHAYMPLYRCW